MKSLITGLTLLLINTSILAGSNEVLRCVVANVDEVYVFNALEKTLVINSFDYDQDKSTEKLVSKSAIFKSKEKQDEEYVGTLGSQYEVVDELTNEVIIKLILDNNGSDGESDNIYPFSAKIGNFIAGCGSTSAPAVNYYNAVFNLKNQL